MKKKQYFFALILMLIFSACTNDNQNTGINLVITNQNTPQNSEATYTSLKIKGKITTDNTSPISSRGVCWSTNPNPTTEDNTTIAANDNINILVENLTANTTYYFRLFAISNNEIHYGENITLSTLSFENSNWKFSTTYPPNNYTIESTINFFADGTTKFDEIGPGQGFFITYGTWSLNGNTLTYIWEGNDPNISTYVYTGTLSGTTMQGTFTHPSAPGTWSAIPLD
jgi:hypothetical protein